MYADPDSDPPALVCQVGSTTLRYHLSAVQDLHRWLVEQGGWVDLGAADEKKDPAPGTVEAWGRSAENPVAGWYGLRKGYREPSDTHRPRRRQLSGGPASRAVKGRPCDSAERARGAVGESSLVRRGYIMTPSPTRQMRPPVMS